jgi:glutaredoxin-like protein NrdH
MKPITLYTKPGCQYCIAAKTYLKEQGIEFKEIDITLDESVAQFLRDKGFRTLPVIYGCEEPLVNGGWNALKTMRKNEIIERLETQCC